MFSKDAKITGVWGGRGSGKSTHVKEATEGNNRVIVIDPIGDYSGSGFSSYRTFSGLYKAIKNGWNKGFRVVLDVSHSDNPEVELLRLSRDLLVIQKPYYEGRDRRKITLVVEEMSILSPNMTKAKDDRAFLKLCNLGRHYGVEIIGVSQRPAEVSPTFRGNCAEHYFFRLSDQVDFDNVGRVIGRQNVDQIRALQTHEFIHFCSGKIAKGKNKLKKRLS